MKFRDKETGKFCTKETFIANCPYRLSCESYKEYGRHDVCSYCVTGVHFNSFLWAKELTPVQQYLKLYEERKNEKAKKW